ncbi:hypothetical protein SynBIOSE41_00955 [Synechococcus sp. BIOS-E4-1]|nr:hypothetical protein SynBIOSE41_00955 [Synechococcus sp. BIOS-E4-1]
MRLAKRALSEGIWSVSSNFASTSGTEQQTITEYQIFVFAQYR